MMHGTARIAGTIRDDAVRAVMVWRELDVPVIAAVHGAALGGGFQLALGADIRIVAPDAQLGVFEIRWGIVPDMCGTQLLPPLVGPDVAKELMFTSRLVSGIEAKDIGLATRVADDPRAAAFELGAGDRRAQSRRDQGDQAARRPVVGHAPGRGPASRTRPHRGHHRQRQPGRGGARQPRTAPRQLRRLNASAGRRPARRAARAARRRANVGPVRRWRARSSRRPTTG